MVDRPDLCYNCVITLLLVSPFVFPSSAVLSLCGTNRVVRRILAACVLSFLALLASVSFDVRTNLALVHASEDAYEQLTSCRTSVLLQLISKLQQMRQSLSRDSGNHTVQWGAPLFNQACGDISDHPCASETAAFCEETRMDIQGLVNVSLSSAYSLAIQRLLDSWGTVGDTLQRVEQNLVWTDVLAARLLLTFTELNQQLRDQDDLSSDFQQQWSFALTHLGFTAIVSERLRQCWLDNLVQTLNRSRSSAGGPFDPRLWQIPAAGAEALAGSGAGLEVLRSTQHCLLARAAVALQLASTSASSQLSVRLCCLLAACLIYPLVVFSFRQMTDWIQNFAQNLKDRTEDLKLQRQLAEDLLHQMLPKSVAKQLRQQKHVEAESYEKVSVQPRPHPQAGFHGDRGS